MAFQRHCSENSRPLWVLSDNAAEYVKAENELEKVIKSDGVTRYFGEHGIKWRFAPKRSPQHNSISESLVKVCKATLYGIFSRTKLTETEFTTALKLACSKINSRPLVAMSDDPFDQNLLTITPYHLKLGRPVAMLPCSIDHLRAEDLDNIKISIQNRWQQRKQIQAKFFVKWKYEYLFSLSKKKSPKHRIECWRYCFVT